MKYILQWKNKFSGETGFVGKVSKKNGYFENAESTDVAKKYLYLKAAQNDIEILKDIGEAENNDFSVVEFV